MATGFAPYLLNDIKSITGNATPRYKVDMHGFTKMLYQGAGAAPIQTNTLAGGKREVRFWYRQRNTKAQTDTSYSCDNVLTPARIEATVSVNNTRAIAWHLTDALVQQYTDEANARATVPGSSPTAGVSAELLDILFSGANGILKAMNDDLLGLVTWGKNSVNGVSTAVTLNLPKDKTVQPLDQGMPKLLSDYNLNGLTGRPQIVGSGLMYAYMLTQPMVGVDQSGMNSRLATAMADFWPDMDFDTIVGANDFGVFEPGAVQLVEFFENSGAFGKKLGNSLFGTLPLPTVDPNGNSVPVLFDFQLKELDCPTTLTDMYSGQSGTYNRGYGLYIWKNFGLFQVPADSYRHEDVQRSVNGALHYTASNDCDTCA